MTRDQGREASQRRYRATLLLFLSTITLAVIQVFFLLGVGPLSFYLETTSLVFTYSFAFLLLAVATILSRLGFTSLGSLCAFIVLMFSFVIAAEAALEVHVSLERSLSSLLGVKADVASQFSKAGTGLLFFLSTAFLSIVVFRVSLLRQSITRVLLVAVAIVLVLGTWGNFSDAAWLEPWRVLTIPVLLSGALAAIAIKTLSSSQEFVNRPHSPRGLAFTVSATVALLALSFFVALKAETEANITRLTESEATRISSQIRQELMEVSSMLGRLAKRWSGSSQQRAQDIDLVVRELAYFQSIIEVDSVGKITWGFPDRSLSPYSLLGQKELSILKTGLEQAKPSLYTGYFSPLVVSEIGRRHFAIVVPIKNNLSLIGFIDTDSAVRTMLSEHIRSPYSFLSVRSGNSKLYSDFPLDQTTQVFSSVIHKASVDSLELELELWPRPRTADAAHSSLPLASLAAGLMVSVFIGLSVYFAQVSQKRLRALQFAKARSEAAEQRFRAVVEYSPSAIVVSDEENQITLVNTEAERVLRLPRKALIGANLPALMNTALRQSFEEFSQSIVEHSAQPLYRPNGDFAVFNPLAEQIPIEVGFSYYNLGARGFVIVAFVDITARKEAEEKLNLLNNELLRSNRELDEFAYIASHDLREPLRGISSYSTFLLRDYGDEIDEDGRRKLESLIRLSKRLSSLIESLLYYSRLGRSELKIEPTNLNEVVEGVRDLLSYRLEETATELIVEESLPVVLADGVKIEEVLQNLITNGIKYNDKEKKQIKIGCKKDSGGANAVSRDRVTVYVRDNGIGIKPEHREAVFQIFKRLHSRDAYGGGVGVGLTISQKIINRHGGEMWIESEEGQGTSFFFSLEASPN